jgi:hypothetical protein
MKSHWSQSFTEYMKDCATEKPGRNNFHIIPDPAFLQNFSARNKPSSKQEVILSIVTQVVELPLPINLFLTNNNTVKSQMLPY